MINGVSYSWESISVKLPSGVAIMIKSINYSDESPTRGVYGKGRMARGFSKGNYKAEGELGLLREEFERMNSRFGGQGMYGKTPFNVVISYADDGKPVVTDTLPYCLADKRDTSIEQDDQEVEVGVSFTVLEQIQWGGKPAFIPR